MKKKAKAVGLGLAAVMTIPLITTGCGSSKAGSDTTFTWWIYSGADSSYYTEYSENPAVQYTLSKTWGADNKTLEFEFWQPAAGTAADNYSTMIASGDLPDIIDAVISDPAEVMVEKGYALDITEYVEENMPNYVELVHSDERIYKNCVSLVDGEEHYYCINNIADAPEPVFQGYMYRRDWIVKYGTNPVTGEAFTGLVDGEEHYYCINNIADAPEPVFQGYMYRRDWIVKYGTNPVTGEAFTGGYTDPADQDSWEDDVVFPSGETDPVYISDWEWMFDIFTKAQADLGIDDSYCLSLYYPGFTWSGGLVSSFGGGTNVWYQDEEGTVKFGGDSEQMRAYLTCMNTWYEKGWLDQAFNERTSDSFFAIDDTAVRQGKVGMWNGQQSQLGGRLDAKDGGYTEGIYVAGCAYPINDIYGTDDCKYVEPDCVMGGELVTGGVLITSAAAEKDLNALCAYLDGFFSEEGGLIKSLGLSKEQTAELADSTFYADYGLEEGAYSIGEDGRYVKSQVLVNDGGGLAAACAFNKAPALIANENVDLGYADTFQASIDSWSKYENTGFFQGSITTNHMSVDDQKTCDDLRSKVLEYMTNNAVDFIKGKTDIEDDGDWEVWCKSLQKYNPKKATDIYQIYVEQYPFR